MPNVLESPPELYDGLQGGPLGSSVGVDAVQEASAGGARHPKSSWSWLCVVERLEIWGSIASRAIELFTSLSHIRMERHGCFPCVGTVAVTGSEKGRSPAHTLGIACAWLLRLKAG